jgi:hypothetical protein
MPETENALMKNHEGVKNYYHAMPSGTGVMRQCIV